MYRKASEEETSSSMSELYSRVGVLLSWYLVLNCFFLHYRSPLPPPPPPFLSLNSIILPISSTPTTTNSNTKDTGETEIQTSLGRPGRVQLVKTSVAAKIYVIPPFAMLVVNWGVLIINMPRVIAYICYFIY